MSDTIKKLIAASLAVIVSIVLIVTVTYAWTTLSTAPLAEGIQISIGGGNTILLAPNIEQSVGDSTCNYPGPFNDTLVFSQQSEYSYLKDLDSLSPVSTSDGVNFFIPSYYDITDEEVKNGEASVGELKDFNDFEVDSELLYANRKKGTSESGHYIYLDFWVVSPGSDYTLRVSRGDEKGGSYVVELPKIIKNDSGYALQHTNNVFAASARIGFLANTNSVQDASFHCYQSSRYYNSSYKKLSGMYSQKGAYALQVNNRFTIYEPNGNYIVGSEKSKYVETKPLGLVGEGIAPVSVFDRLTVQLKNDWATKTENNITLDEVLAVSLSGKKVENVAYAESMLYDTYLQGQFSPYVTRGSFITETNKLFEKCLDDGEATELELASLEASGATEDVYITKLEKNVPQRIRMYVWIEGQDIDCIDSTQVGRLAISLELAASNQE